MIVTLSLICFGFIVCYLTTAIIYAKRLPESISETSYIWEAECNHINRQHRAYIFSLFCLILAGLLIYPWCAFTPLKFIPLCIIGCLGVIAAGCTPFFKEKGKDIIHYVGGMVAVLCSLIWMGCLGYWVPLGLGILTFIVLCIIYFDAIVLWGEITALFFLIGIMILN